MRYKLLFLLLICIISIVNAANNSTINITQTIIPTIGPTPTIISNNTTICPAQVIPTPVTVTVTKEVEKIVYKDRVVEKEPDEGRLYNIRRNADIQLIKDAAKLGIVVFGVLYILSILIRGIKRHD